MSKGNMLLGHARGKVGDIVFSRSNGQQIVRARAAVVKNPKTTAQIIQRIKLYTVVQAYSAMKSIVDHSFEGVSVGQKSMSKFTQEALKVLDAKIKAATDYEQAHAFSPLGTGFFALNQWPLSTGTLPQVSVTYVNDNTRGTGVIALSANTYQGVIDQFGLKRGDQLTFCTVVTIPGAANNRFDFARVILDPRDENGNELPLSTAFANGANGITSPNPRNEGTFNFLTFANGTGLSFAVANAPYVMGAAVIVSRKAADGTWLRSKANLVLDTEEEHDYALGDAIRYAQAGNNVYGSDYYLNNAGVSANGNAGEDGGDDDPLPGPDGNDNLPGENG